MIEPNNIYLGDCLDILPSVPDGSVDMILQDPPYNTTACKWEWDIMTKIDEFWKQWKRIIKPNGAIVMTASQPFTSKLVMSNLKMFKYEWVWEKTKYTNFYFVKKQPAKLHENIMVFYNKQPTYNPIMQEGKSYIDIRTKIKRHSDIVLKSLDRIPKVINKGIRYPSSIQKFMNPNNNNLHPTQKPVTLFEYLIRTYTNEGDTVYDGFAGSFTTAIACIKTNRRYICIEKRPDYFALGEKRIALGKQQTDMFREAVPV